MGTKFGSKRKIKIEIIEWKSIDLFSINISMQKCGGKLNKYKLFKMVLVELMCGGGQGRMGWVRGWRTTANKRSVKMWKSVRDKRRKKKCSSLSRTMGLIYFRGEIRKQNDNSYEIIGMVNLKWKISMKIKTMKHFEELNQFFTARRLLWVFSEFFPLFFFHPQKFVLLHEMKNSEVFFLSFSHFTIFHPVIMSKIMSGILSKKILWGRIRNIMTIFRIEEFLSSSSSPLILHCGNMRCEYVRSSCDEQTVSGLINQCKYSLH